MIPNHLPASLDENPLLSDWIGFETGGRIRVSTGKVEIGQGVLTALAQVAAEELDVVPARLSVVSGDTRGPNEGFTAGSLSVEASGSALRVVCAEIRLLMLREAGLRLKRDPSELSVRDGVIFADAEPTALDYWLLAGAIDLARPATGTVPAKSVAEHRLVGRSARRLDLPAKLAGAAFIHDLAPAGMLHARVLRQPWRDAVLAELDEARLRRAGRRPVEILREGSYVAFLSLDEATVEAVAVLAREIADWSGTRPPDDVASPAWLKAQPATTEDMMLGDHRTPADGVTVVAEYSRPLLAHASIGPCCALAHLADKVLTVRTHSQGVFPLRASLARALDLPLDMIRVIHDQGSGCYGHNGADDAAFDASLLALRHPGQAVRVQWTRADELTAAPFGAPMSVRIEVVLDPSGHPSKWLTEIWSAPHGQRPGMGGATNLLGPEALPDTAPRPPPVDIADRNGGGVARNAVPLYCLPAQRVRTHFIDTYPVRTSSIRGLGAFANVFAIECFIDELAERAGVDPVAYRLGLLADARARAVIKAVADMAGWSGADPIGEGMAKGLGFSRYKNRAGYCAVVAEVGLEHEARLIRVWCAVDAGLVVNPDGALNQIEGGIVQAASWTLKEAVRIKDGRAATTTWETYPISRFSDAPRIETRLISAPSEAPLGLGEVSQGPTAAAIGNAIARALGLRIRHLPLDRDRIEAALAGAAAETS